MKAGSAATICCKVLTSHSQVQVAPLTSDSRWIIN
jgi:hypothetical protein